MHIFNKKIYVLFILIVGLYKLFLYIFVVTCFTMHSNVVANLPMSFVANLPKLWRTFPVANLPVFTCRLVLDNFILRNRFHEYRLRIDQLN